MPKNRELLIIRIVSTLAMFAGIYCVYTGRIRFESELAGSFGIIRVVKWLLIASLVLGVFRAWTQDTSELIESPIVPKLYLSRIAWLIAWKTGKRTVVPLKDLVSEKLPCLTGECGFRLTGSKDEPDHFGNSAAMFESETIRLYFRREKGIVLIFISPLSRPEAIFKLTEI